jgi:Chaperone of endosialidase
MATAKEKCFSDAMEKYQDATGKDLGTKMHEPWRQNVDGSWSKEPRGFWAAINSMKKFIMGNGHSGSVVQTRVPDLTVQAPKGPLAVDLKFTRADGTVDDWRTKPGAGNGQTQRNDYNEINRQTDPNAQDLTLDPESCNCKGRGSSPQTVLDPALGYAPDGQFYFVPMAPLGPLPAMPGLPAFPGFPMPAPMPVPSDERIKFGIQPLDFNIELLMQLEPVKYRMSESPDAELELGFIAQQVEKLIPELVETTESGRKLVHYTALSAIAISALKWQQQRIYQLEQAVQQLQEMQSRQQQQSQ